MNKIKSGFAQFDVRLSEVDVNLKTAISALEHLGKNGVDLAVLPEMWSCGFDNANLRIHADRTPEILDKIAEIAMDQEMVVAGSLPEFSDGKVYNTLYLVERDGSVAGAYRKVHLFSLTEEHKYFGSGNQCVVCETSVGKVGLMICYDLRFPELCRTLALKGAEIVIVTAQWPKTRIGQWDVLSRARAIENQLFLIAVNRCGKDIILKYGGNSRIVSPLGNLLTSAQNDSETQFAEMDFGEIGKFRKQIPCLEERVPDVYDI